MIHSDKVAILKTSAFIMVYVQHLEIYVEVKKGEFLKQCSVNNLEAVTVEIDQETNGVWVA